MSIGTVTKRIRVTAFTQQSRFGLLPVSMTLSDYDLSIGGSRISSERYTPEFKDEAIRQIVDHGYSVTDVTERLGTVKYNRIINPRFSAGS